MPSVIMLSFKIQANILSVIRLSVVAPFIKHFTKITIKIGVRVKQHIYFPLVSALLPTYPDLTLTCLSPSPSLAVPPPLAYYASPHLA